MLIELTQIWLSLGIVNNANIYLQIIYYEIRSYN